MEDLKRANKVTAYWEGNGVAIATFYKTHDKITEIKSNSEEVVAAGFVMPEGTDEAPVTAPQKLEAFKNFVSINATAFGISYDPIDRRADEFKFPGKYTEETIVEFAGKMLAMAVEEKLASVQNNVVANMVKAGNLPDGSEVQYGVGESNVVVTEKYNNGNLKYASVEYPIAIAVGAQKVETTIVVDLVSGQLKKPRNIGTTTLTMTGIKEMLVGAGVLPKIEKVEKEDKETEEVPAEAVEQ